MFFWLSDVNLAIERVKTGVSEGGHNIPEEVIIRRYFKGINNLTKIFIGLCDNWMVIDNSSLPHQFVAEGQKNESLTIYNSITWELIKNENDERR